VKFRSENEAYQSKEYINFRDVELLIKKAVSKKGYKAPH